MFKNTKIVVKPTEPKQERESPRVIHESCMTVFCKCQRGSGEEKREKLCTTFKKNLS